MQDTDATEPSEQVIDRVPTEILSRIFRLAGQSTGILTAEFDKAETWPWGLVDTCRRWHRIIFQDPSLWSKVVLRLTKWDDWPSRFKSLIPLCLQKSLPCALSLEIHLPRSKKMLMPFAALIQEVIEDLKQIITSNSSRLIELAVFRNLRVIEDLFKDYKEKTIPELRHLALVHKKSGILCTSILPPTPRLTSLHLQRLYIEPRTLPWSGITSLTCHHLYVEQVSIILGLATALEHCKISNTYQSLCQTTPRSTLCLIPSLLSLILHDMAPWPITFLRFPKLKALKIDLGYRDPHPDTWAQRIYEALNQSDAVLHSISIRGVLGVDSLLIPHLDSLLIPNLLASQKALRKVKICAYNASELWTIMTWFLEMCTLSLEKVHLVSHSVDGLAEVKQLLTKLRDLDVTHPVYKILIVTVYIDNGAGSKLEEDIKHIPIVRIVERVLVE